MVNVSSILTVMTMNNETKEIVLISVFLFSIVTLTYFLLLVFTT